MKNPRNPKERAVLIAMRKRRRRVACLLFEHPGITQQQIAAKLGVSQMSISLDIRAIYREWFALDSTKVRYRAMRRIKQYEYAAYQAMQSFLLSRKNAEKVTTTYEPRRCQDCSGKGEREGVKCQACDGTGKTMHEVVTRQVAGQAGDPSHLRNYIEAIQKCVKLEGLEAVKDKGLVIDQRKQNSQINIGIGRMDWSKLSDEELSVVRRLTEKALKIEGNRSIDSKENEE
jgi:biotin operon repressor